VDSQTLINALIGGFSAAVAFILRVLWEGLRELQRADVDLAAKVADIQLLVAGNYVKKDELDGIIKALFAKLDKIEDKLDKKVDRT
jgi:CHASE3 domain sensor protein